MEGVYEHIFESLGGIPLGEINSIAFQDYLKQNSIKLPEDIRNLLCKYGNQYFNDDVAVQSLESVPIASSGKIGLGSFVDIDDLEQITNLLSQLGKDVFPVMEGCAGDYIVVGTGTENFGEIYYWFHEAYEGEELIPVFNSFADFVEHLIQNEDEDDDSREVISYRIDF